VGYLQKSVSWRAAFLQRLLHPFVAGTAQFVFFSSPIQLKLRKKDFQKSLQLTTFVFPLVVSQIIKNSSAKASPKILSVDNISLFPFKTFHSQIIKNSSTSAQNEMENLKWFDIH
jgi:hypothetical protein